MISYSKEKFITQEDKNILYDILKKYSQYIVGDIKDFNDNKIIRLLYFVIGKYNGGIYNRYSNESKSMARNRVMNHMREIFSDEQIKVISYLYDKYMVKSQKFYVALKNYILETYEKEICMDRLLGVDNYNFYDKNLIYIDEIFIRFSRNYIDINVYDEPYKKNVNIINYFHTICKRDVFEVIDLTLTIYINNIFIPKFINVVQNTLNIKNNEKDDLYE